MLIHGLADDNVVVAHTLRLSGALLAAGYPHTVLPLSGITHMASQEAVAENLLLLQLDFLRRALGLPVHEAGTASLRCWAWWCLWCPPGPPGRRCQRHRWSIDAVITTSMEHRCRSPGLVPVTGGDGGAKVLAEVRPGSRRRGRKG